MRSGDRERFLARIRGALAGASPGPERRPPGPAGFAPGPAGLPGIRQPPRADHPGDDPSAWPRRFIAELEAVGGAAQQVAPGAVGAAAVACARTLQVSRVLAWDPARLPLEEGLVLAEVLGALSAAGCRVRTWPAGGRDDAELGVVVAEAAIAASGTVVLSSGPGRGRSVSLLPEHLLVLVPSSCLRPTLAEALAGVAARTRGGIPHTVTLITGPSKSADIEQQMIHGVHGPRTVHALVLEAAGVPEAAP